MARSRLGRLGVLLLLTALASVASAEDDTKEAQTHAVLEGVVVDQAGHPVADVLVEAWRGNPMRWFVADVDSTQPFDGLEKVPADFTETSTVRRRGRTDAKGRFRFEGLDAADGYRLRARPAPPWRGRIEMVRGPLPAGERHRLVVEQGRTITGRIVDEKGNGRMGWITAHAHPGRDRLFGQTWFPHSFIERDLLTDAEGRFTFAAPPDVRVQLDCFFPGDRYITSIALLERDEGVATLVIPASGGASIRGHVRDIEGVPIAGARILVAIRSHEIGYRPNYTVLATSDAQGAFGIDHLPATDLDQISVQAPGFGVWNRGVYLTPLMDEEPLEVDVTLVPSPHLVVRVVDEQGSGVPEPELWFVGQMVPGHNRAWTRIVHGDADGVVRLDSIPTGRGSLQVWAPGHYQPIEPIRHALDNPLARTYPALEPGSEHEVTVVLKKGPTLRGRVLDHRGQSVPHAVLGFNLHRSDAPRGNGFVMRHGKADADGRFELGGLPPLTSLLVTVTAMGYAGVQSQVDVASLEGHEPVTLLLPEPAQVGGRVVDELARPLDGVLVQCEGASKPVVTDAEGRFAFAVVMPGRRRLFLGSTASGATTRFLDLQPGQLVADLVLRLPGVEFGVLEGVVQEGDGTPAYYTAVEVRSAADPQLSGRAFTDAKGHFRLERVPPGTYEVSSSSRPVTVTIGEDGSAPEAVVRRASPPTYIVRGVVVAPDGNRVDTADLRISHPEDGGHTVRAQTVVMGGRFRTRVRGTPHKLALRVENARDARGRRLNHAPTRTVVPNPADEPVLVALKPALALRGRIIEDDGRPVPGLSVSLTPQTTTPHARRTYVPPILALTDEDGRFEVLGLEARPYHVTLPRAHRWVPPGPLLAEPGTDELEIRLVPWQSLVTLVTAPDGSPVAGCRVEAHVLTSGRARGAGVAMTDAKGRAEHPRMKPGEELTLRILPPHPGEGAVADLCPRLKEGVSPGGDPVNVQLSRGARLGGRVVDAVGRPICDAPVSLTIGALEDQPASAHGIPPIHQLRQSTQTDGSGYFLFRRLPHARTLSLHVSGPRKADPRYFQETRQGILTGSENLEIVLQRGVSIEGRVPDVEAGALEGVRLRAQPLLRGYPNADFVFDGTTTTFTLDNLRPGPYEIHVRGGRDVRYERVQTVEAPAVDFVLKVTRVHNLAVAVMGAKGKPYVAVFHLPGRDRIRSALGADGVARFQNLPDARGTLVIYLQGESQVAVVEDVYTGRGDPLVVELIEGHPIQGRIVGQSTPLAGGRVIATRGDVRFEGLVSEEGLFQTPALPPGDYKLEFAFKYPKDGFVPAPGAVTAGTTDLVLEWAKRP